jgi:hypothetical protein
VSCLNNGRCGIAVTGTSRVEIIGGTIADNGRHQVLISNTATAKLSDVTMAGEPAIVP